MNKKIFSLMLVGLAFAVPAFAATTVSLAPLNVSVTKEQSFTIAVSVSPESVKNYTVKLAMEYPADILEATSFGFGNGWMALAQPGYDVIDNGSGTLVKTAGYPGGLGASATFGTVTFKAKQSGSAAVEVTANSLALDAQSQNVIGGLPVRALVTVTAPVIAPAEEAKKEKIEEVTVPSETESLTEETEEETVPEGVAVVEGPNPFLAAVSRILTFGTGNNVLSIIFLFVTGLVVYGIYTFISTRKKK